MILPETDSPEDETALALICAIATAIVAVISPDGKNAYRELKQIVREVNR
jgi:hypothetical protein